MSFASRKHWTALAWFFTLKRNPGCSISRFKHSLLWPYDFHRTYGMVIDRFNLAKQESERQRTSSSSGNRWIKERVQSRCKFSREYRRDISCSTKQSRRNATYPSLYVSTDVSRSTCLKVLRWFYLVSILFLSLFFYILSYLLTCFKKEASAFLSSIIHLSAPLNHPLEKTMVQRVNQAEKSLVSSHGLRPIILALEKL